jgi:hypothetical protein
MNIVNVTAAALALSVAAAMPAWAIDRDGEPIPQTLYSGTWLCSTPENYDLAIERAANASRDSINQIRTELLEAKQCIMVDEDDVEDMMAPFVTVLEQRGDKVLIRYTVEFERRIELLHRQVTQFTFSGWTDRGNLRNYYEWLTGKPQT